MLTQPLAEGYEVNHTSDGLRHPLRVQVVGYPTPVLGNRHTPKMHGFDYRMVNDRDAQDAAGQSP